MSFRHWFTTRRSRALKRRLSGRDDVVVEAVDAVVVLGVGTAVVVEVVVLGAAVVVVPVVVLDVLLGVLVGVVGAP